MSQRRPAIRLTRRYRAAPEQIFRAWLDPDIAGSWLFATASRPMASVAIDARVSGAFRFVDERRGEVTEFNGEYIEIVPHRRLAFTLCAPHDVVTRVSVDIEPRGRGCAVTLTHEDVPPARTRETRARWTGLLYGLGEMLDARPPAPSIPGGPDAIPSDVLLRRNAVGAPARIGTPADHA